MPGPQASRQMETNVPDVHGGMAADPMQQHMDLAEQLARLTAGGDEQRSMLVFSALVNLLDGFARREAAEGIRHARSVLLRGTEPLGSRLRSSRRSAISAPSATAADSVYSDPVFLANARALISDRRRLVGGVPTDDYPDCVAVGNSSRWCCSGTLVAANVVVTAGHCHAGGCRDRVLVGNDVNGAETLVIGVSHSHSHPQYDRPSPAYDLCTLVLEDDVSLEPRRMADLEMLQAARSVRLAGYGNTDVDGSRGYGRRRIVDVPLAASDPKYGADPAVEFVAGAPFLDRDSCNGDSGGPAYVWADGEWYLVGATSRATASRFRRCGDGGIYTYIPALTDWIRGVPGGRWS
jgi:hypothetical protein